MRNRQSRLVLSRVHGINMDVHGFPCYESLNPGHGQDNHDIAMFKDHELDYLLVFMVRASVSGHASSTHGIAMFKDHELDSLLVFMVRASVSGHESSNHGIAMFKDHGPIIAEHTIVRSLDMTPVLQMRA